MNKDKDIIKKLFLCATNEYKIMEAALKIYKDYETGFYTEKYLSFQFLSITTLYAKTYSRIWEIQVNTEEIKEVAKQLQKYYRPNSFGL